MPIKLAGEQAGRKFLALAWLSITSLYWLTYGGPAWLPALIFLIFIGVWISAGCSPYRRTPFDFALVLFSLMTLVGVWAAYDHEIAFDKLWMFLLAIVFFYAIAGQPQQNSRLLMGLISFLGVFLSLHFLFIYDWRTLPVDFGIIARLGMLWMGMRPPLQGQSLTPNITAGVLAGLFPITLAFGISIWQQRSTINRAWLPLVIALSFASLQAFSIFMTSSRGAWFALALGLGVWTILVIGKKLKVHLTRQWKVAFLLGGIALGIYAISLFFINNDNPARLLDLAPGLHTGQSRQGIGRLTVRLIRDFPFTGGGLGAFPGLFSQYMLVIPNLVFKYSHNLYLDITLEQGLPGLLALLVILGGSVLLLLHAPANEDTQPGLSLLRHAALVSLVVMVTHGMIDNPFYGERGTPFLWVVAGLAAFTHPTIRTMDGLLRTHLDRMGRSTGFLRWVRFALISVAVAVGFSAVISWRQLAASWLANLGAVSMARMQLRGFPTNQWTVRASGDELDRAQDLFERSIALDPTNQAALYRLGILAMQNQDFQSAIDYLEAAYRQDMGHRGVIKHLGYAYVWGGQYAMAQELLAEIPEARREMQIYSSWWAIHDRPDLAHNAEEMARRLASAGSVRPVTLAMNLVIP